MPVRDIIDNHAEKLIDHLGQMLATSERARFAVGYLFLSGLTGIARRLLNLKEIRLLIGNTSNRETVKMLAEGYHRLDLAAEEVERQAYPTRMETEEDGAGDGRNCEQWEREINERVEALYGL